MEERYKEVVVMTEDFLMKNNPHTVDIVPGVTIIGILMAAIQHTV